jgi:hypothetical protein
MASGEGVEGGGLIPGVGDHDITTLQVKSDSGRQTLLLKFHFNDTVGDVYDYVTMHRTKGSAFVLRSSFPAAVYSDRAVTLQEAGLVPNATLRIAPAAAAVLDGSAGAKK